MSAALSSKLAEPTPNSRGPTGAPAVTSLRQPSSLPQWLIGAAVVLGALVAISRRSLWIDEAATAIQALQPTLTAWWQLLLQEKTAHLQMPFYMLYIWGYAKAFGTSEWALRAANLPWFVTGAVAFVLQFPAADRRRFFALGVVLACPFAWYYLDEARPYAMQLGAGLWIVASLRGFASAGSDGCGESRSFTMLIIGVLVLCGSSLLGMVWAAAALATVPMLVSWSRIADLLRSQRLLCCAAVVVLFFLGSYYVWTLKIGARATAPSASSIGSVFFIWYEVLGFAGLGPGRLELRDTGPLAMHGYWTWLVLYGVASACVVGAALLDELRRRGDRRRLLVSLCACAPAALIIGAGWIVHFRVLGRHFAPFVAVLLLLFTNGLFLLWGRRFWFRALPLLFFALSLASCLGFRFAPRHERDNYRAAATLAKAALRHGQSVWWSASPEGARYYGLTAARGSAASGQALLVANPPREALRGLPPPELIIASKPDVYDGQTALAEYIHERGYYRAGSFPAFVIWEKSGK